MIAALLALLPALAAAPAPELLDAGRAIPGAAVDLRYATPRNIAGRPLQAETRCLLRPAAVERLRRVAADLEARGYRLLLWDCYRPPSVQRALWSAFPDRRWVADPARGSSHGRGTAVDASIVRLDGSAVEMPTDHDAFVPAARPWARAGISAAAVRHRAILAGAMERAGFSQNRGEWWHFEAPGAWSAPPIAPPVARGSP